MVGKRRRVNRIELIYRSKRQSITYLQRGRNEALLSSRRMSKDIDVCEEPTCECDRHKGPQHTANNEVCGLTGALVAS